MRTHPPGQPGSRSRRATGGLFYLVLLLLLVLAVAAYALLVRSSQLFGQVARGAGGMACESLARSVIKRCAALIS